MRMKVLVTVLLVGTLLAGCSSGGKKADDLEKGLDDLGLKATDTTGVIRGVVVDAAIVPLEGAVVQVTGEGFNQTVTTKEDGLFGLDGLQPGFYSIEANRTGYLAVRTQTEVIAGVDDPPIVKLQLNVDQALAPFFEERVFEAFIGCSVTTPTVSAAACDLVGPVQELTNNAFLVSYEDLPGVPMWVQSEAVWESTQPTGGELSLSLTDFSQGAQVTVADAYGTSPIYWAINETVVRQFNYGTNNSLVIRVFSTDVRETDAVDESTFQDPYRDSLYPALNGTGAPGVVGGVTDNDPTGVTNNPFGNPECIEDAALFNTCFDVNGVGIVVNQKVTVFTHLFYGYTPPAGWRFSDSNLVPQPPSVTPP